MADKCSRFLAAQHNADRKVKTTHVHCALENFESKNELPVEGVRTFIPSEFKGRGQYAIMKKTERTKKFYHYDSLCVYIIKASLANVRLVNGISPVTMDELASKWIDHSVQVKQVPKKESRQDNLNPLDLYALMEAKVPKEDIEEVIKASKLLGKTISESLQDPIVQGILKSKEEYRRTADATATQSKRTGAKQISDDEIMRKASKGEVPEAGSDEADRLFWARRGGKR